MRKDSGNISCSSGSDSGNCSSKYEKNLLSVKIAGKSIAALQLAVQKAEESYNLEKKDILTD